MDVLSDVLQTVRLQSQILGRLDVRPPWGIRLERRPFSVFHLILEGSAWFQVENEKMVRVEAGDVLMLPRGNAHSLRDDPTTPAELFDVPLLKRLNVDRGAKLQGVCGMFRFEDRSTEQLFAALPRVLHVRELDDELGPWLEQTMRLIGYESKLRRPGGNTTAAGLCDTLFVYLLRTHLARLSQTKPSWLRALSDPQIGQALQLIHSNPMASWTVPELASKVAMSRSKFAARFAEVVGRTPLQYVIDWRLQKAASLLRTSTRTLAEIASDVGYESEAAFNKAFKKGMGTPPGEYRTRDGASWTLRGPELRA